MRKLTYSDAANWDLYLPATLFAYCLSKHCVTGYPSFAMLYGQEATTPLFLGAPCLPWQPPELTHSASCLTECQQIVDIQ
ncbi:hypothetical protein DSO57_1010732 [Entomophthora muscae]|uniref:Uncharacterized protein n=1 Tax=Entomophthora muscae TaxID=34485 RepID=A0ACC2SVM7_9FUNG|nr:hypothetical protein DSO57_1010732 [Entomophthora muscae]